MYIYTYMYIFIHTHAHIYLCVYTFVCVWVYVCVCLNHPFERPTNTRPTKTTASRDGTCSGSLLNKKKSTKNARGGRKPFSVAKYVGNVREKEKAKLYKYVCIKCICMYVSMYVCICICICVCTVLWLYVYVYIYIHRHINIYIRMYIYIRIYIYMYILHVYIYIYVYLYISTYKFMYPRIQHTENEWDANNECPNTAYTRCAPNTAYTRCALCKDAQHSTETTRGNKSASERAHKKERERECFFWILLLDSM